MLPNSKKQLKKNKNFSFKENSSPIQNNHPIAEIICFKCSTDFGFSKNSIIYNPYVIKLKNSKKFQVVCSKCLQQISDEEIELYYSLKEFRKFKNEVH